MPNSPIIVEDFYADPLSVRATALKRPFTQHEWRPRLCEWKESFIEPPEAESLMQKIEGIVGKPLSYDPRMQGFFRLLSTSTYEVLKSKDVVIHIDDYDWSGIVCLSQDYPGVLPFFRHKTTGLERLGTNSEWGSPFHDDSQDWSKWELIQEIEIGFNRLILFDPKHFHFVGCGMGNDKNTSRLTQQFQFNETVQIKSLDW